MLSFVVSLISCHSDSLGSGDGLTETESHCWISLPFSQRRVADKKPEFMEEENVRKMLPSHISETSLPHSQRALISRFLHLWFSVWNYKEAVVSVPTSFMAVSLSASSFLSGQRGRG